MWKIEEEKELEKEYIGNSKTDFHKVNGTESSKTERLSKISQNPPDSIKDTTKNLTQTNDATNVYKNISNINIL